MWVTEKKMAELTGLPMIYIGRLVEHEWVSGKHYREGVNGVEISADAYNNWMAARVREKPAQRKIDNRRSPNAQRIGAKPTALYRHYDEDGLLLYVGISLNPIVRLQQHKESGWWDYIATVRIERFENRKLALEAETDAIVNEKPAHNIIHNATEH